MTSSSHWTARDIPAQDGRTVLVTGASSGLGYVTALELARRGAHVILAVRNTDRGEQAAKRIRAEHPAASLDVRHADLADLGSVKAFAEQIITEGTAVDVLINNAGIMMPPLSRTADGHESQLASNHLGHFALTGLLLGTMRTSRDPRVVTVTSMMHHYGTIDFGNLAAEKSYSRTAFYCTSKLANALFGIELDRRLRAAGSPIRSVLAHPGYASTNLGVPGASWWRKAAYGIGGALFAQSAERGALPQLYAATSPAAEGGQLIGPDGLRQSRGFPTVVKPSALASDPDLAARFWTVSEDLTKIQIPLPQSTQA
jgi:NAD(P)-dependent dehydrogenase (short-subunit alcohol dehydrogenase family)